MTTIAVACPACGFRSDRVPAAATGKSVRCPRCRQSFRAEPLGFTPLDEAPATTPEAAPVTTPEAPVATTPEAPSLAPQATSPRATPLTEWKVGDVVLGLYEVLSVLGQGGMGRVYRVRHRGWDMDLAVKTPLAETLAAAGGAAAFEREAETWVGLGLHPHIVTCHYVRRVQDLPRVFAEFVDAGSLHDAIRSGRLRSLDSILDAAIQFAWGLHYAHEQGLVHRDVKPGNAMISGDGIVKVTDFGLARAGQVAAAPLLPAGTAGGGTLVVAGGGAGTVPYVSPEQAGGGMLTRRSDLWSWALAVLEMFAGGRGWEYGPAAAEALADYMASGSLQPGLPPMPDSVAALLRRCFEQDAAARPHDLMEAAAVLAEAYASASGSAYPRTPPRAGRGTADSLNNSAVSMLDLDRETDALALWEKALAAQPQHLESTYNQALHEWTRLRLDDAEMSRRFGEALKSHASQARAQHLDARLGLALGEFARAAAALDAAARLGASEADLQRDRALALAGQSAASDDTAAWRRVRDAFARALDAGEVDAAEVAGHALALGRLGDAAGASTFYREARARRGDLPEDMNVAFRTLVPGQERVASLLGSTAPVVALVVRPDGSEVVAGGGGREARVWAAESGAALRKIVSEEGRLRALAVTPDGRYLLWAAEDAPLRVFDLAQGRSVRSFPRTAGSPTCLAFTPDARLAVAGYSDRVIRVFDTASGQLAHTLEGHEDAVTAVAVGASRIVSGGRDAAVRVWDLAAGRPLATHRGHAGRVGAVALDEARQIVLSAGDDRSVRVWPWDGEAPARVFVGPTQAASALAWHPGGLVLVGSVDRSLRLLDVDEGHLVGLVRLDAAVHSIATHGKAVFVGHGTTVSRLELPERPHLAPLALARPLSAIEAQQRDIEFEARLERAKSHLAAGDLDLALDEAGAARAIPGHERSPAGLEVWDALVAQLPRTGLSAAWEEASLLGHTDQVLAVAVSTAGAVASAGNDRSLRLHAGAGAERVFTGHEGPVPALAFSPDGRRLWSGSWDHTVRCWDAGSGKTLALIQAHDEYVLSVALSPDGHQVASAGLDQTVRLWRSDGAGLAVLQGHEAAVASVAFARDGKVLVSGGWDQTVRVWDAASHGLLFTLEGAGCNVTSVCVAPRAAAAASGGADGVVRLWDLKFRKQTAALAGHQGEISSVAFTEDGRFLVSSSRDGSVRVWDVGQRKEARALRHPAPILSAALSSSGTLLASGGADSTVRLWRLDWKPERPPARLRLKPETIRIAAPVEAMPSMAPTRSPARVEETREWEDVRREGARTIVRRPPARREPIPWRRLGTAAVALLLVAVSFASWRLARPKMHLVAPVVRALQEDDLINLAAFTLPCSGGFDEYMERVHGVDVSAVDIACLAKLHDPRTVDAYFAVPSEETDLPRIQRVWRNAISLMAGLGEAGVDALCPYLGSTSDQPRRVATMALSLEPNAAARECLVTTMRSGASSLARASAVSTLPRLLARDRVSLKEGVDLVHELLQDPDPAVRSAALLSLDVFSEGFARPLAEAARADADADVKAAAEDALRAIAAARQGEALEGG